MFYKKQKKPTVNIKWQLATISGPIALRHKISLALPLALVVLFLIYNNILSYSINLVNTFLKNILKILTRSSFFVTFVTKKACFQIHWATGYHFRSYSFASQGFPCFAFIATGCLFRPFSFASHGFPCFALTIYKHILP